MTHLLLTDSALAAIRLACEEAFPLEACGLLLGSVPLSGDAARHVTLAVTGRNLEASAQRFRLDPSDFLRADSRGRELGLDIVGSFHSHPERPALPSADDEAEAQAGWSHVIVSVAGGRCVEVRSWERRPDAQGGRLAEEPIRIRGRVEMSGPSTRSA